MVNIVGLTVLQSIRKFPGFENAIIAGGFVRDDILGGTFTDVDIYVPLTKNDNLKTLIFDNTVTEEKEVFYNIGTNKYYFEKEFIKPLTDLEQLAITFKQVKIDNNKVPRPYLITRSTKMGDFSDFNFNMKNNKGYVNNPSYNGHIDCKYMGNIDVDILGIKVETVKNFEGKEIIEDFGTKVIDTFNYNIDKCYFDGVDVVTSPLFEKDMRYNVATLCKLESIDLLPLAMKKYFKLKEKYPNITWKTSELELKKPVKTEDVKQKKKSQSSVYTAVYPNTTTAQVDWDNVQQEIGQPMFIAENPPAVRVPGRFDDNF